MLRKDVILFNLILELCNVTISECHCERQGTYYFRRIH
nr:MAG TPA: hypothetical protein [Caudoviricetes sp.]